MVKRKKVVICLGSSCFSRGAGNLLELVKTYIQEKQLEHIIEFKGDLCSGLCRKGPHLQIDEDIIFDINEANIERILDTYFIHTSCE